MAVLNITKANFEAEVLNSDKPVLLDFWAAWCGPCKMLSPIIEELAEEVTDAKICKVNIDEEMDLARQYNVMSIPTLIVVKDGKTAASSLGYQSKEAILELLR